MRPPSCLVPLILLLACARAHGFVGFLGVLFNGPGYASLSRASIAVK